jgi:hypothetical protein
MPAWISPNRLSANLTKSSSAAVLLLALVFGCARQKSAAYGELSQRGYVRLQLLMEAHPGWVEVAQIDAAMREVAAPASLVTPAVPLVAITLPSPLTGVGDTKDREALLERRNIEAIREPARQRIEKLQRTSTVRSERNVTRKQADVKKDTQAKLIQNEENLTQQEFAAKAKIDRGAHAEITRLSLKEIAINSELESLGQFPGLAGTLRADVQRRLSIVVSEKKAAEAKLASELQGSEDHFKKLRETTVNEIRKAGEIQIEAFEKSERKRVAGDVARNKNEVDAFLTVLDALETPLSVKSAPVIPLPISFPSFRNTSYPSVIGTSGAALKDLRSKRDRMVSFIRKDITRRLDRLYHSDMRLEFTAGFADKTQEVSGILKAEWNH